jgi:N6-L-threonylcarbamoyladenine synthase
VTRAVSSNGSFRVLGIETSCDETAAAVVCADGQVLSDVIESQFASHAPYGGIVPELASRDHLRNARPVIEGALERAGLGLADIDGIAVTARPGLAGALHVGVQVALGLAFALDKPVVGVDHLLGHMAAAYLRYPERSVTAPRLPFLALLVSGGHTALYRVDGLSAGSIRELGATRDDAAGEAFDKVGKLLGLGYPGGPVIDRLASQGDAAGFELPRPMSRRDSLEFSFSGLKTSVARWVEANGPLGDDQQLRDLCAAFQHNVVEALLRTTFRAARAQGLQTLVLAGGVAANRLLRARASAYAARYGMRVLVPHLSHCTDNAAMIALAGSHRLARGENQSGRLAMSPNTALERVTRKGAGPR